MIQNYTKEEFIDLVDEYISVDREEVIDFTFNDENYMLEFVCRFDYGDSIKGLYNCRAKLFEEYNCDNGEISLILEIDSDGLIAEEFVDGWHKRVVI